jgi:hypothetical protein
MEAKGNITFLLRPGELQWSSGRPKSRIVDQPQTSKATPMRLLAHARGHPDQPFQASEDGNWLAKPGVVHAQKAGTDHQQGRKPHQVIASRAVHQSALSKATII